MKRLLFIFLFAITTYFAQAQSGTFNYDATKDVGITGGDSATNAITSYQWATQGAQAGPVVFTGANTPVLKATVTVAGSYLFILTVKTNLGKTATGTIKGIAYGPQVINIDFSGTGILKTTLQ
jgi:hypothetical protein